MGQKRRFARPDPMSALPPIPTVIATSRAVAKGHKRPKCAAAKASLFDHFVGDGEYARWNAESESLGGLEIDDQFEFGRLHHGQVCRIVTLQNSSDIIARLPITIANTGTITQKTTSGDIFSDFVDCWNGVMRG
jgi:hypothetical protein